MTRICFAGITGWTAPPIVRRIEESTDLRLVSGVSRSSGGRTLAEAVGATADGRVYADVATALASEPTDVLVDFTSADAVRANVWSAVRAGVHVVVGSSGLTSEDYAELDPLARQHKVGVIAAGNFSIMAAVLLQAAGLAARQLSSWEIIDYASATKPDVPSGTARELAETLAQIKEPDVAVPAAAVLGPVEARGAAVAGTRIHSVRLPGFVVSTEIVFGAAGERLVIRHDPGADPEPYAAGVLLAIRNVADEIGVRRGLGSLLA